MTSKLLDLPQPVVICASVVEQERLARDTYRIRLDAPELARRILPGQFVMLRSNGQWDPLLARPFALYDVVRDPLGDARYLDLVYLVFGRGTQALSELRPGTELSVWGPLGNTFPNAWGTDAAESHLALVAGGIGQTPFLAVAKAAWMGHFYGESRQLYPLRPRRVTLLYGTRTREYLACISDFERLGIDVRIATDDGSAGHAGRVTELVQQLCESSEPPTHVFGCGPVPMLRALHSVTQENQLPTWVSLETKMACGYGVCFSCVCPVREGEGWDYRRVCTEGPIFPSDQIDWKEFD